MQPDRDGKNAIPKPVRVASFLNASSIAEVIGRRHMVFLPEHAGAGPCGSAVKPHQACVGLAWSITHLVCPLRAYYATYVPPMRLGGKTGPRHRLVA
jgi:hypothetical protein